jgi:hypothetical protein
LITRRYPKYAGKISQIFPHGDFNRNTGMCGIYASKVGIVHNPKWKDFSASKMRFFIIQLGPWEIETL